MGILYLKTLPAVFWKVGKQVSDEFMTPWICSVNSLNNWKAEITEKGVDSFHMSIRFIALLQSIKNKSVKSDCVVGPSGGSKFPITRDI